MNGRRKILRGFQWKRREYVVDGYIVEKNFSEIELDVLERMGNIEVAEPVEAPKTVKPKATPKRAKKKAQNEPEA